MQVLRVCSFSTFSLPPAFPPCCCPLAFRPQVRRLTSRMSSASYPGYPECVVSYHGADRLANSIRALSLHFPCDCIRYVTGSLDHRICLEEEGWGDGQAQGLRGLQVYDEFVLHGLLDGEIRGLGALEN